MSAPLEPPESELRPSTPFLLTPLLALLLLPLGLAFLVCVSLFRAFSGAVPWIVTWLCGFLAGGAVAQVIEFLPNSRWTSEQLWLFGGGLGLFAFSSLRGVAISWSAWASRHDVSPFSGLGGFLPQWEAERQQFANQLQFPAVISATLAGVCPMFWLIRSALMPELSWPSAEVWALCGAVGLTLEGALMGAVLGTLKHRTAVTTLQESFGEALGRRLARENIGWRGGLAWSIGYAIHQVAIGAASGFVVGFLLETIFQ
ncbi:hypothetical protein [Thalassoroseus pseudoceratinae]|uniref:hypothetical protein n=1 Tax=Thalassoroseus pseudoceratinae TaxID=2713176 RepID=UPI00142332EA|nr:hypothetical protein [Thalassoroseus pseudoceratinae]